MTHIIMSQGALHVKHYHQQIDSSWGSSVAQDVIHTGIKCRMASEQYQHFTIIVWIKHVSTCRSKTVENIFCSLVSNGREACWNMNTVVSEGSMLKHEYCCERRKHVETGILLGASEGSMLKQEYCWERRRQVEKGSSIYRPHIRLGCSLAVIRWILFFNNNIFSQQKWSVRCSCRRAGRKIKGSFYF